LTPPSTEKNPAESEINHLIDAKKKKKAVMLSRMSSRRSKVHHGEIPSPQLYAASAGRESRTSTARPPRRNQKTGREKVEFQGESGRFPLQEHLKSTQKIGTKVMLTPRNCETRTQKAGWPVSASPELTLSKREEKADFHCWLKRGTAGWGSGLGRRVARKE
jgi:hypothetical protein